jgi:hypothetical protein
LRDGLMTEVNAQHFGTMQGQTSPKIRRLGRISGYRRLVVLPPIGKQKNYPQLVLTVIYARERGQPHGRDKIDWKLLTDLPVPSCLQAIEKLEWYAQRWKIETFHKILKSDPPPGNKVLWRGLTRVTDIEL